MKIIDFYTSDDKAHWLSEIKKSDWGAGKYLYELLHDQKLKELCGEWAKVLLLVDDERLISFCTYAEQDDVREPSLTPWVGFVYTFPEYRGKRRVGKLLEYVYILAKNDGHKHIYISTGETGLYEKYGYQFWKIMKDAHGDDSRVYRTDIVSVDYSDVLGTTVSGTIDRPLGSAHPRHPEMIYPINYGYVDGVFAGDGAEQDVYVFGADKPMESFSGRVVAVYHRLNDNEDKWIVSLNGETIPEEDILEAICFQEQYFMGELYTLCMFLRQIVLQQGIPFEMKLPVRKPIAMGSLTKEEIDAEISKGMKSIEEGRVYSADAVEAEMMRDFGV